MMLKAKSRYILLSIALILLITALIWSHALRNNPGARICNELRRYGYTLNISDLNHVKTWENTSLKELINAEDIGRIEEISKQQGFGADVDKKGEITLITANVGTGELVLLLLGEEIELAFINDGEELKPLG